MSALVQTDFTTEAEAIRDATDWRSAVDSLINFWTALDRCYSSGEIAACLRTHRMDLRFSVTGLGEYVRDLFYQGALPAYNDGFDNPMNPVQVSRYTTGKSRTGSGVLVFVYGPEQAACEAHDFEIEIPRPGSVGDGIGPVTPAPTVTPAPKAPRQVPAGLPDAYVGADGRCYVPRKVVDEFLAAADLTLRYGDEVHVTHTGGKVEITGKPQPGSKEYNIWQGTGKVAFYSQDGNPFQGGMKYPVSVTPKAITVDLTDPR